MAGCPEGTSRRHALAQVFTDFCASDSPATAADFALWTGITLTDAREIWAREQAGFASVKVEGWAASVLRTDLDELTQAKLERPLIRLLPYFDSFLLGHKEREHLVDIEHQPKVYRPQGWIVPVVLVDGRVTAVWKHVQKGNRLRIEVAKFGALSPHITAGIREEARDLGRFLGTPNVDVQIG